MLLIITGGVHSGKSLLAERLVQFLKSRQVALAGILAPGLWRNGLRQGFDLVDLGRGLSLPLARRRVAGEDSDLTPFAFFAEGLFAGARALDVKFCRDAAVIMVDEVGRLELQDKGWAAYLKPLLGLDSVIHIWIVRESLVEAVCRKWQLQPAAIVNVADAAGLAELKLALAQGGIL
ncbi:MAG: hypothetical protein JXR80_10645 [Deltaproteobacteria bacterium]|nr:hypothetical protein [Deltaproteobacteria bacterium]